MPDIAERILQFNQPRDPEKVLLKYKALTESSFRFLRGTCHLFYEDLCNNYTLPVSPNTWLCGDLHVENFGSYKGSDREVYFDINDFDEAILGPALYELSRLLVSVQVACNNEGYKKTYTATLLNAVINGYCKTLQPGKPVTVEDETATGLVKALLDKVALRKEKKLIEKKADPASGYKKLLVDNEKTFEITPSSFKQELVKNIQVWLDETKGKDLRKVYDAVHAITGTGSIGINRYLALVSDTTTDKKYLLVIKQAMPSSLRHFINAKQPVWTNDAQRISQVELRMQHITPGGFNTMPFRNDWYTIKWVQQEADKITLDEFLANQTEQTSLMDTIGCLAASAQLRSSGRDGSAIADELIRFSTHQEWIPALLAFAETYALQVEKDYQEYCSDYGKGYFNVPDQKK